MIGILLIDKPLGCSSHEVVHQLRRKFGTKRVGHAGTLDPLATGLLVVAVGPATRFLQYLPLEPKLYRGEITFGVETNTYDAEGEIVAHNDVPADLAGKIQEALDRFTGLIEQVPPDYINTLRADPFQGIVLIMWALVMGSALGVVAGVFFALVRGRRAEFPFGPALALGCTIAVLFSSSFVS